MAASFVCVNMPGALITPLLLFGGPIGHTVYLNTQLCSENLGLVFRREIMQNNEACPPQATGYAWPPILRSAHAEQDSCTALLMHSGELVLGWQDTKICFFLSFLNSFILSVLFVHLDVLIF